MADPKRRNYPAEIPVQSEIAQQTISKQKRFTRIILGVLMLLILVGGEAYYVRTQSSNRYQPAKSDTGATNNQSLVAVSPTLPLSPTLLPETEKKINTLWRSARKNQFLKNNVVLQTPSNFTLIDCGDSINFADENGPKGCGTEPNQFAINVYPDSEYRIEQDMIPNKYWMTPAKQEGLTYAGKPALRYILQTKPNGPIDYKQKVTAIKFDDSSYLYVVLQSDKYETIYERFLNNIIFK